MPDAECWVFGQQQGRLLISSDGGDTWASPSSLGHCCGYASTLAVSPQYPQDRTLWAGLPGLGLWASYDGGRSWRPIHTGLPSMGMQQIQLSPSFALGQTAFVRSVHSADLCRTMDGGAHWQSLQLDSLRLLDLSKEFAYDRTLMGLSWEYSSDPQAPPNELLLSTDGGQHWSHAGELGASRTAALLSLAPLFTRWQVLFVHGDNGWPYRSENGGAHWVPVLYTGSPESDPFHSSPRLVYGPEIAGQRTLFLLVTQTEYTSESPVQRGQLYRSPDGGQSWQEMPPPDGIVPSALAISPAFEQDGLLFLGSADGRVVAWASR
ncbi:MAG: hypothetical protein FJ026_10460 [Chloroflexi bacterium]|nr:hypothetical protein [Chloroflexota bacterium]